MLLIVFGVLQFQYRLQKSYLKPLYRQSSNKFAIFWGKAWDRLFFMDFLRCDPSSGVGFSWFYPRGQH